jgi:hypothetical protein
MVAISNHTGEVVEDEDVYATVARPRGSGSRNELCRRHLVAALGMSKREWQDIIVGLIALTCFRDTNSNRSTHASSSPSAD